MSCVCALGSRGVGDSERAGGQVCEALDRSSCWVGRGVFGIYCCYGCTIRNVSTEGECLALDNSPGYCGLRLRLREMPRIRGARKKERKRDRSGERKLP